MGRFLLNWQKIEITLHVPGSDIASRASQILDLDLIKDHSRDNITPDIFIGHCEQGYSLESSFGSLKSLSEEDLIIYLVTIISAFFLSRCMDTVLHAGAFVVDSKAILFSGHQQTGKSSLAYLAWKAGYPVVSDDWLIIDSSGCHIRPFPKPVKPRILNRNDESKFRKEASLSSNYLLGNLHGERRAVFGRRLQGMVPYQSVLPISHLFLIERGEKTHIYPLERNTALSSILEQVMPTNAPPLHILRLIEPLWQSRSIDGLTIGEGELDYALELMANRNP